VVVGSGPGGLQTSYWLGAHGVRHAIFSADDAPGGMFRRWPVFQRLLTWSKPAAPAALESREYERYDLNSLTAAEPALRALVPRAMGRESILPTRAAMESGLAAFAQAARLPVRYGCRWTGTRREPPGFVLETTDGEYRCRFAVFAIGVTEPWKPAVPGIEAVQHYADVGEPATFAGKRVAVVGKRNSGFELASALLPWASRIVLISPQPVRASVLARTTVRAPYFQPLEEHAHGGGTFAVDAVVREIRRAGDGFEVLATAAGETPIGVEADAVVAATGFTTPLLDLPGLGVETVGRGRIPALTPLWESVGAPGVFFAGNASQGAPGLRRHGGGSFSTTVQGFRYNAAILARHLAERLSGRPAERPLVSREALVALLGRELAEGPELWLQKGYLARAATLEGEAARDEGIVPLEHFLDGSSADGIAVTVEVDARGSIRPVAFVRRAGRLRERTLDPHPLHAFDGAGYRNEIEALLAG
jgi:thioredoxin reductase